MKCPKCNKECKDLSYSHYNTEGGLIYHCEEHGDVEKHD
jgi:hypothetical protein